MNEFLNEVKPDDLVNMVIPVYDRNFTSEEVDGMLAFYSSPVGQKVLALVDTSSLFCRFIAFYKARVK